MIGLTKKIIGLAVIFPITVIASDLNDNKVQVFEALKKNGIIVSEAYDSATGIKNGLQTLLTNTGIIAVNYKTKSIFINNDIIHINKNGEFVSSNARVIDAYLNNLEFKIVEKAQNEKYRIQVFLDVACPHCRRFYSTTPQLNQDGITVEYILMAGGGDKSPSFMQMSEIQSQDNQNQALSNLMNGIQLQKRENKVSMQMFLHQQAAIIVGVTGTPTIFYKGLKLPIVEAHKYPEILLSIENSLQGEGKEYKAHRVN